MGPGITIYRVDPRNGWKPPKSRPTCDPEKECCPNHYESHITDHGGTGEAVVQQGDEQQAVDAQEVLHI